MAKITRKNALIFGSSASLDQIAQYGSLAAGSPALYSGATADPDVVQALANWIEGWFSGVEGASSPAIEDLNAYCFVMAYQIAYQMQTGVPEWNSATNYYIGSVVNDGYGNLYVSKTDANLNHALSNTTYWQSGIAYVSGTSASSNAVGGATAVPVTANKLYQDIYVIGNGTGWAAEAAASVKAWQGICWSPTLNLFCAVAGGASTTNIMTSPTGITWTTRTGPTSQGYVSICWSPYNQLFVAVPSTTTATTIATSPDGTTWTARTNADAAQAWSNVIWSAEVGLFVAVSTGGSTSQIQTSPDGITWTLRATGTTDNWTALAYSPDLSMFVALGTSRVLYSRDGITWKNQAATNGVGNSLTWSASLGIFLAVVGAAINYSSDGITWTNQALALAPSLEGVSWSPELGLFVAVGSPSVGTNAVVTSNNGSIWSYVSVPEANMWRDVCFAPALNRFAAVSDTGTNRAMINTSPAVTASASIAVGTVQGQRATLIGGTDGNIFPAILTNNLGTSLKKTPLVLTKNSTTSFIWDSALALWIQV